ncbi:MAG: hypothetical protein CSA74_02505 [Rhodobacterales bacterium]|nr:MAG: hypothetical protein CSA74_02505 [Rhodobacterales bacterium]
MRLKDCGQNMSSQTQPDLRAIILRSVGGGTGIHAIGAFLGFLVGIQLARGLGADGYGVYGSAVAVARLGATGASGGLNVLSMRDVSVSLASSDVARVRRFLLWSTRHIAVFAFPISILAALVLRWVIGTGADVAVAAAVLVWMLAVITALGGFLRGFGSILLGMAIEAAIRPAAFSVLLFLAAILAFSLTPAAALWLTVVALGLAMAFSLRKVGSVLRQAPTPAVAGEARRWFNATLAMRLTVILAVVGVTGPLILVGALSSMAEAGTFRLAVSITTLGGMLGSVTHQAFTPLFTRMHAQGEVDRMRKLAAISVLVMAIPPAMLFGLTLAFGDWAIGGVFGEEFVPATVPTAILFVSALFYALGGVSQSVLQIQHAENAVNIASTTSVAVTLLLCLVLIPESGPVGGAPGAAIAITAGIAVRSIVMSVLCYRKTGIDASIVGAVAFLPRALRKWKDNRLPPAAGD